MCQIVRVTHTQNNQQKSRLQLVQNRQVRATHLEESMWHLSAQFQVTHDRCSTHPGRSSLHSVCTDLHSRPCAEIDTNRFNNRCMRCRGLVVMHCCKCQVRLLRSCWNPSQTKTGSWFGWCRGRCVLLFTMSCLTLFAGEIYYIIFPPTLVYITAINTVKQTQ